MKVICYNVVLTRDQLNRFNTIIENNKKILNPCYFFKNNRALSYVSFIMKEIYEYLNIRISSSIMLNDVNLMKKDIHRMREKNKLIKLKLL